MAPSPRILIVEDEVDLIRMLDQMLRAAGFQVLRAYGGEDAVRKVKLHKPDLVLTDLAMPKMSGVEIISQVKGDPDTKHIPCVAMTSFMWDMIAQSAGQAGCDGYLPKPFDSERLLLELAKFVAVPEQAGHS